MINNIKNALLKIKANKKIIFSFFVISLCSIVLILTSGYAYVTMSGVSSFFVLVLGIFTIFILLLIGLKLKKEYFSKLKNVFNNSIIALKNKNIRNFFYSLKIISFIVFPFIMAIWFVLSFVLNISNNELFTIAHYLILLFCSFSFVVIVPFNKFKKIYCSVFEIICFVSVVIYFVTIISGIHPTTNSFTNVNHASYSDFLFVHFTLNSEIARNCGPFWEPGIYSTFILVAIVFEIISTERKINYFRLCVFVVALITTFSTAGIALLFLVIPLFCEKRYDNKIGFGIEIACFVIVILFAVLFATKLGDQIPVIGAFFEKFRTGSFMARLASFQINLSIYIKSPIFGFGPNYFDSLYSEISINPQTQAIIAPQSSTTTWFMGSFGLAGIVLFLIAPLSFLVKKHINDLPSSLLLFFIYFLCMNKEPHYSFLISWIITMYLLKRLLWSRNDSINCFGEQSIICHK